LDCRLDVYVTVQNNVETGCAHVLLQRLMTLTHEQGDFLRQLRPGFYLLGFHQSEASGQLLLDGAVGGLGSAQLQLCRQIIHHFLTFSIFASKPASHCNDPVFAQLPYIESGKAPSSTQVILGLLHFPVLKKCIDLFRGTTPARFTRHVARLSSFPTMARKGIAVLSVGKDDVAEA
jgi:hypothetical protein